MPQVLTSAAVMICPHGGSISAISSNQRAKADGTPILRPSDTFVVAGCAFNVSGAPHPCLVVEWQSPSVACKAAGDQALTTASIGLCKAGDGAVQGPATILSTQMRTAAR